MRKVTYGGAVSLDFYLAGENEAIDWLRSSEDVNAIIKESWKGVDTMLMGRKTFEFGQRMGGGPAMKGVTTYVFSRTLESVPEGVELVRDDAADFVRALKAKDGPSTSLRTGGPSSGLGTGDIIVMGGGELGSALIEAGLVDEIGFNVHPLLLGGGIPAFRPMARRVELDLIEARPIAKSCVLMRYKVVS
jgi:dihydrofolate reductase